MADSEVFAQGTDQSFSLTGRLNFEEASCGAVFPAGDSACVACMQLGDAEEAIECLWMPTLVREEVAHCLQEGSPYQSPLEAQPRRLEHWVADVFRRV